MYIFNFHTYQKLCKIHHVAAAMNTIHWYRL